MGILDNTAASITVTSDTNLGTISEPPTISYTVRDTNPGQYFGVNHYLDRTTLWFGAIQFDVKSYESNVTKTNTFTVSSATWFDIYDGPHTIILRTENGTGLRSQATVSFIRTGNPEPEPEQPYLPPTTINPINPPVDLPTFSDNEVVKMGVLRHVHLKQGKEEVTLVKQAPSKIIFPDRYGSLFVEVERRYRNGYTVDRFHLKEQITFVDTYDKTYEWAWVKTTLPNGKTIFISTTFAPSEYLYPLTEIHVKLKGCKYILRNLTEQEWKSIDKSILSKIDFGNPVGANVMYGGENYTRYYIVTRTSTNHADNYYDFLRKYDDKQYKSWIDNYSNHTNERFKTMTYVSEAKSKATSWQQGWSYREPVEYNRSYSDLAWIPVLELENTDPIIDLPDKRNSDPTINI